MSAPRKRWKFSIKALLLFIVGISIGIGLIRFGLRVQYPSGLPALLGVAFLGGSTGGFIAYGLKGVEGVVQGFFKGAVGILFVYCILVVFLRILVIQ